VGSLVGLLAEARPYVESFAQLTKHPTADMEAMALAKRMRRAVQAMQGKETKTVDHVGETPDRLNGTGTPASPAGTSFRLRWHIDPVPVALKSRDGEATIVASNLMDACHKLKNNLSALHCVPVEKIEVTRATLALVPTP
jgi:hypothetical protein